jgi:hypothetical protein
MAGSWSYPTEERECFLLLLMYLRNYEGENISIKTAHQLTDSQLEDLLETFGYVRSPIAWLIRPGYPPAALVPLRSVCDEVA